MKQQVGPRTSPRVASSYREMLVGAVRDVLNEKTSISLIWLSLSIAGFSRGIMSNELAKGLCFGRFSTAQYLQGNSRNSLEAS